MRAKVEAMQQQGAGFQLAIKPRDGNDFKSRNMRHAPSSQSSRTSSSRMPTWSCAARLLGRPVSHRRRCPRGPPPPAAAWSPDSCFARRKERQIEACSIACLDGGWAGCTPEPSSLLVLNKTPSRLTRHCRAEQATTALNKTLPCLTSHDRAEQHTIFGSGGRDRYQATAKGQFDRHTNIARDPCVNCTRGTTLQARTNRLSRHETRCCFFFKTKPISKSGEQIQKNQMDTHIGL